MDDISRKTCIVFYDMLHSNNAARIRLWLRFQKEYINDKVKTKMITHQDLESNTYQKVNPLKKVPALTTDSGMHLFEAAVIMGYLEDYFFGQNNLSSSLVLDTPDDRAFVNLMVRCHDLYIASPNCTQPHFTHTQGCMYLDPFPAKYTPPHRTIDVATRAAKLKEIYKQLSWLNDQARLPFLAGNRITHADLTWFPTSIFMEIMLPFCFGWSEIFYETDHFPKLTTWFQNCLNHDHFKDVRLEIYNTLMSQKDDGRLIAVKNEAEKHPEYQWKFM